MVQTVCVHATPAEDFIVIRFGDGWCMLHSGRRWGRFTFQVDAEQAAIRLAGTARAGGRDAGVYVQSQTGELRRLQLS
jgi:hypothetical protein